MQSVHRTYSIFIPLQQGLRQRHAITTIDDGVYSIFIPLQQGLRPSCEYGSPEIILEFYLHSITTRIKTRQSSPQHGKA